MRCNDCGHAWHSQGQGDKERWCTFNPVWITVKTDHFCGQYASRYRDRRDPAHSNRGYIENNSWHRECNAQQTRAIEAEKKLKAARKELRELRASKP